MDKNNNKERRCHVNSDVSLIVGDWLENMKTKYGVNINQQISWVISAVVTSESALEELVVKNLLADHEAKIKYLQKKAKEFGLPVVEKNKVEFKPVIKANVVDVFTAKKHKNKLKNDINKCLNENSDVNTVMKSKLEEAISNSPVEVIDWNRLGAYRYKDLDILGMSLKDYKVLEDQNYRKRFKNGLFATLHNQALGLWRDEEKELTIRDIAKLQPTTDDQGNSRVLQVQTIAKRIFKAIVHFGSAEEKKLLFGTADIYPIVPRKKKLS